jgi:predicted DNA-binding protein YlxM (UPF0122 family)
VRFFGEELSISRVANDCHVKRDTAAEHNKRVVTYLEAHERVAEIELKGAWRPPASSNPEAG